jgi:2-octaprenyl-6-methoxyphenol hydroxylase
MAAKEKTAKSPKSGLYDAIISGGGLAGLSLACLLGVRGMKILCIDALDPKAAPQDLRTTAISFGSRKILERAGVWDKITQACPIEDIQILDGSSPLLLEFLSREVGGKAFGWICDNHDLKQAMMARMKELKTVTHVAPAQVTDFEVEENAAHVILKSGDTFSGRLMIGADGRNSFMRKWMSEHTGLRTRGWSYKQRAVVCCVSHENPHHNVAVEHFYPQGPFAILPMADDAGGKHRSSVVFTEHGPERHSWMELPSEAFEAALAARFPASFGSVKMIGQRAVYPLSLVHASEYIAKRMVLVADAAHGIHPIAGQGLNLGFRDLDMLDILLGEAFNEQKDIGAANILENYQRIRRPDNMAMIAFTDALVRLFSNDLLPVRLLRRAGLKMVSRLRPAKDFFMKQAMGDR